MGPHIVIMLFFFFKFICLFIFGCTGSLPLPTGFLSRGGKQAALSVVVRGLLIAKAVLWSTGSGVCGLQYLCPTGLVGPWHVESS